MEMQGHTGVVYCIAYFPNGEKIASGSSDKTIRIWDAYSGKAVAGAILEHPGEVEALSILPDGNRIVSGCDDGTLWIWDVNNRRCIFNANLKVQMRYVPVAFSPDGENCAFASRDGAVQIQELKEGGELKSCVRPPTKSEGDIISLMFSHDGSHVISGSEDGSIVTWNAGKRRNTWQSSEDREKHGI